MSASSSHTQQFFHQDSKVTKTTPALKAPIEVTVDSSVRSMIVSASGDIIVGLQHGGILVIDAKAGKASYKKSGRIEFDQPVEESSEESSIEWFEVQKSFKLQKLIELQPNVVCAARSNEVLILDLGNDVCQRSVRSDTRYGLSLLLTNKGYIFTAASAMDETIRLEDPATWALIWSIECDSSPITELQKEDTGSVFAATCLPNGDIACGTTNGFIFILNAESGEYKKIFKGYEGEAVQYCGIDWYLQDSKRINRLAALPNNDLVSGSQNGPLYVWDSSTGDLKHRLVNGKKDNFHVSDLKIHGHYILCLENAGLHIWDGLTGNFLKEVTGLRTILHDFAVTPEGDILIRDLGHQATTCRFYQLPLSYILGHEKQSIPFNFKLFPKRPIVMECEVASDSSQTPVFA